MAALTHWASNDGATWGDRRRSRGASFLSGTGPSSRLFTGAYYPVIQHTVVVDGALPVTTTEPKDETKTRRRETIFGPDVGDDDQPGWTNQTDGNAVSVDVIKRWVDKAKSEEGVHSTTTLQALVNLKRPSLLLQPMEPTAEADVSSAPGGQARPLHLLKFNYDSMTPLVKVTLTQYPTVWNQSNPAVAQPEPRVLYTGVHPGGFNQSFALPAEAAIDLSSAIAPNPPPEEAVEDDVKDMKDRRASEETTGTSAERVEGPTGSELQAIPELNQEQQDAQQQRSSRRFGLFGRRREHDVEQGNIEMTPTAAATTDVNGNGDAAAPVERDAEKEEEEKKKREEEHGMRLVIQLDALGPDGELLRRRNGQLTHILVSGTWQPDAGSTATSGTGKRVWVVKVVRREAQIGAHSFLLKEIYGLSSAAGSDATSYPPSASDPYASTPNECIVCLTSPRDVVLLPCRHLVVCRECAVGMVEFGAGGRVARRDDDTAGLDTNAAPATGAGSGEVPPLGGTGVGGGLSGAPAPPPPPPTTTRRKKKAKGWYCPVCRQPYTSLLRLALPPSKAGSSGTATPAGGVTTDGGGAPSLRRAASVRSVRTTHSVATLPEGAEAMLSRLGPQDQDDDDDEEDDEQYDARMREQYQHDHGHDMPQFVVAEATTVPQPPPASHTAAGPPVTAAVPTEQAASQPAAHPAEPPTAMTTTATNPASVTNGVANMRVAE